MKEKEIDELITEMKNIVNKIELISYLSLRIIQQSILILKQRFSKLNRLVNQITKKRQ